MKHLGVLTLLCSVAVAVCDEDDRNLTVPLPKQTKDVKVAKLNEDNTRMNASCSVLYTRERTYDQYYKRYVYRIRSAQQCIGTNNNQNTTSNVKAYVGAGAGGGGAACVLGFLFYCCAGYQKDKDKGHN